MVNNIYPTLSSVISTDQIPEELDFLTSSLDGVLDSIHFRNLVADRSINGASMSFRLDIVSYSELLKINIPGTGLVLLLNPDLDNPSVDYSIIPLALTWDWGIQQYIKDFKLSSFSFEAEAFYSLIFKIANIQDSRLLPGLVDALIEDSNPLEKFVLDTNSKYPGINIPYPLDPNEEVALDNTIAAIESSSYTLHEIIFQDYIVAATLEKSLHNIDQLFFNFLGFGAIDGLKDMLIPRISARVFVSAGLEIPRSVLIPIKADGEVESDINIKTTLLFEAGELVFNSKGGFGFEEVFGISFPTSHPKAQIANTGISIGFTNAKLDLSTKTNILEADLAGYPQDFRGLYVQDATIELTRFGQDDETKSSVALFGQDILIGTGGFSGTIGLASDGKLYRKFGTNFAVELNAFSLTFRQGAITSSSIAGLLTIPRFKTAGGGSAIVAIQASIFDNGDFSITALPQDEPYKIVLPNVLELDVRSLSVGNRDDHYFIALAGKLNFIANIPGLGEVLPKDIEIHKLVIWDNGDIEFEGGSLKLQKSFRLKVGPVKLEVSNISLGGYKKDLPEIDPATQKPKQLKYYYFGFDGMINTGRAGVNATGNGIKYYFSVNHEDLGKSFDHFVRIDGIGIDMAVPEKNPAFLLNGYLSMSNPDPNIIGSNAGTEYTGSVSFSIPKIKLAGSAGMRLQPDIPAFVVDIGIELPAPVPLGAGLGIYGFRGLIGQHYVPSKSATTPPLPESASWWEYYKSKSKTTGKEGIEIDKFGSKSGFSVGAGASIATLGDSGKAFSSKLFLLLGLPDVFLIQGQAAILRERVGLNDTVDPPFSALIVFSSKSIEGNLGVNYNLPESGGSKGAILSLQGKMEMAFFFNNASGWYLNVGRDQPESARVRSRVLSLFQGHAYLMLSMRGIKAGAGVRFDFNKRFGPVGVGFGAFLNMGGFISFKPVQIGGYIQVGGYAYIKVFRFKFGFSVGASLAVEAPHPFNIIGSLEISFRAIKRFRIRIDLTWRINNNIGPLLVPIPVLQLPDPAKGYLPAAAINILSEESFPLNYVTSENSSVIPNPETAAWKYSFTNPDVLIPLDSFIDIELLKPVRPGNVSLGGASNQLASGYKELIPPQKGVGPQVVHQFELTELKIYAWQPSNTSWQEYNIYEAVTAIVDANTVPPQVSLTALKPGYWQFMEPNKFNKIRLLSQHMFSFASRTKNSYSDLDAWNFNPKDVFCYDNINKKVVVDWIGKLINTRYPNNRPVSFKANTFIFKDVNGRVKHDSSFSNKSLYIEGDNGSLEIIFPEPVSKVTLNFGTNNSNLAVKFGQISYNVDAFGNAIADNEFFTPVLIAKNQQSPVVEYNASVNEDKPIDKVVLEFSNKVPGTDYEGDLIMGGHFKLPDAYSVPATPALNRTIEMDKSLQYVTFYNRSFTAAEVLTRNYLTEEGIVAQWPLANSVNDYGIDGLVSGSPETVEGFYEENMFGVMQLQHIYSFAGNTDAVVVPYDTSLKIENGSFAFEVTAVFNPFSQGISTLLYKVKENEVTGHKKGFALHLCQNTPGNAETAYTDAVSVPSFTIWLTCYSEDSTWGIQATEKYTVDCATSFLIEKQYKNILVSVNRTLNKVEVYIDSVLKISADVPAELEVVDTSQKYSYLNQFSYTTARQQTRQDDHPITPEQVLDEVQLLGDGINRVLQPVWRPNTTYAVKIKTRDVVNNNNTPEKTHIFGFKTAGPVGHFHKQNKKFQQLAAEDRADEFKLASLKHYIDYERSFPDAQSRYDLSKPVFLENPQIRLFFTKPYINAMFSNWNTYLGLPEIESKLDIELLAPNGTTMVPELQWETLPEVVIDDTNFHSLPEDLKIIYLMNKAASGGACSPMTTPITKKIKQGVYQFSDPMLPDQLYTALVKSVYKPAGMDTQVAEVHKFSFKTSRYTSFEQQVNSLVIDSTPGAEKFAVHVYNVAFTTSDLYLKIKPLINETTVDDPVAVLQYAMKYDRLIYGGLLINNLEPVNHSTITLVVNTDSSDSNSRKILGVLIRNPEPFNDPKLPSEQLKDTVQLSMTLPDTSVLSPELFTYIHSRDTSAVFITNEVMDIPLGSLQLAFKYKLFNGATYDVVPVTAPSVNLPGYVSL